MEIDGMSIQTKRECIYRAFCETSNNVKTGNVEVISVKDLENLYRLYDQYFFAGWFSKHLKTPMVFSFSNRMTKSAGMTLCHIKKKSHEAERIEIRISIDFLFNFDAGLKEKSVGGLVAKDSLGALLLVFEHELCHAYEFALTNRSSCKQKPFQDFIRGHFGHTQSTHGLPTVGDIVKDALGIQIGGVYQFDYKDQVLTGHLTAIHKNAVMMVPDTKGRYKNSQGKRYTKYYVGIHRLRKCE